MYAAMLKRQQGESIERQKELMISAIYSNPNYGSDEIEKAVSALEDHYRKALELVYAPPHALKRQHEYEPDWQNPFWAGAKASYDKQKAAAAALRSPDAQQQLDARQQRHERRQRMLEATDQMAPKK